MRWKHLAWTLALLAWALSLFIVVMLIVRRSPFDGFVYSGVLAGVGFSLVGAGLVAARPPTSSRAMGWVFLAAGLSVAASGAGFAYLGDLPLSGPGSPAGAIWVSWFSSWSWSLPTVTIITLPLLLFPDGRLPSSRAKLWLLLALAMPVVQFVYGITAEVPENFVPGYRNPIDLPFDLPSALIAALPGTTFLMWAIATIGSVIAMIGRFRRADPIQRQQIKWFVYAGVLTIAFYGGGTSLSTFAPSTAIDVAGGVLSLVGVVLMPAAVWIAIRRHRLYDIERIIGRTVTYAIVSAILGTTFALFVILPSAVVGSRGETPDSVVAGATLAVAALTRPLGRRVQQQIDRRFNRRRYDAVRTIEGFSARLREETDIETLRAELRGIVMRTMQPTAVSLWLRPRS